MSNSGKLTPTGAEPLPKIDPLPGAVVKQVKTCGRSGCRCARGELHGPYFYRVWREKGKQKKQYVKAADVEETQWACFAWMERRIASLAARKQGKKLVERMTRRAMRDAGIEPLPSFMVKE